MKKFSKFLAGILSVATLTCSAVSCKTTVMEIDNTKTQLYVGIVLGGSGTQWAYDAISRFEAKYASTSFEEGKVGVQIMPLFDKDKYSYVTLQTTITLDTCDVYCTSFNRQYHLAAASGNFLDISDVLESKADESESVTIKEKLFDDYVSYYSNSYVSQSQSHYGKWYALPFALDVTGLNYDIDFFEEQGFYFAEDGSWTTGLDGDSAKSAGPDGRVGTLDDGLPATWAQFKTLVNYIAKGTGNAYVPFTWTALSGYAPDFLNSVYAANVGKEQFELNYNFNGTAKLSDENDNYVRDVEINDDNAYLLAQQYGKKYPLEVAEFMVSSQDYYSTKAFDTNHTHIATQREYVQSKAKNGGANRIAMILEGDWWENEADSAFTELATDKGEEYARKNRRFGYLPFPKKDGPAEGGDVNTLHVLEGKTWCANAKTKNPELAKAFIKFMATDTELSHYTGNTGLNCCFDYDLESADRAKMTHYSTEIYEYIHSEYTELAYKHLSTNPVKHNNSTYVNNLGECIISNGGLQYNEWISDFYRNDITSDQMFKWRREAYSETEWKNKIIK